jgi:hypothetical protein
MFRSKTIHKKDQTIRLFKSQTTNKPSQPNDDKKPKLNGYDSIKESVQQDYTNTTYRK